MLKTLIRTIIAVALLLASLQLVYWTAVRRQAQLLIAAVAPTSTLSYESIEAFPPGALVLHGVRLAVTGREAIYLQADRVSLNQVDRLWMLAWLSGFERGPLRRFGLQVEGLQASPELLRAIRGRAGVLGLILPFEAVGCAPESVFDDSDYAALGWQEPRLDMQLHWHRRPEQRRVDVGLRVDRHPSGVVQADLSFVDVSERASILSARLGGARLDQASVRYDNAQALAQRNAHCVARVESGSDFLAGHLRRVHELLRDMGVVPDEPIWAAYRAWLEQGGTLNFTAEPAPGVPFAEYPAFAPEDRLRLLGLSLQIAESAPVPVEAIAARTSAVAFRPLPEEPVPEAEPTRNAGSAQPSIEATPPPRRRPVIVAQPIEFAEVANHHGEQVRIATIGGGRHVGLVLGSTDDAIELQISRYGGAARLPIAQEQISRIELLREEMPRP